MFHQATNSAEAGVGAGLSVVASPIDPAAAERIALDRYGLDGSASWLAGEKDSNFQLATGSGELFFLKVLSPGEDPAFSRMHTDALLHVAARAPDLPLPRIVRSLDGAADLRIAFAPEDLRTVRMTTFSPGRAQSAGQRTAGQRRAAGAMLARLQAALADFDHPAADHATSWDMRYAGRLRPLLEVFSDVGQRERLRRALDGFETRIAPLLSELPAQVVHNDLNGDNILVDPADPDRITGVIDFGDMVRTARLFDVAIGAAYQLGSEVDLLWQAAEFLRGYVSVAPLSETEISLLPIAIETRMAMRLLIPQWRAERFPERRDYIIRNSPAVWRQFDHLEAITPDRVAATITAACRA